MEWTDEKLTLKMYPDVRDASYSKNHVTPFMPFLGEKLQWSLLPAARSVLLLSAFNALPTCKITFMSCPLYHAPKWWLPRQFLANLSLSFPAHWIKPAFLMQKYEEKAQRIHCHNKEQVGPLPSSRELFKGKLASMPAHTLLSGNAISKPKVTMSVLPMDYIYLQQW